VLWSPQDEGLSMQSHPPAPATPSNYSKRTNKRKNYEINNLFIPASVNDKHSAKVGSFLRHRPRVISNLASHLASALKGVQQFGDSKVSPTQFSCFGLIFTYLFYCLLQ